MQGKFFPLMISILLLISCSKETETLNLEQQNQNTAPTPKWKNPTSFMRVGSMYSMPISIDTANKMINSYLASVNYPTNDNSLRSLSFDADSLRAYLAQDNIKTIKFMLAHRLDYINSGNFGTNTGSSLNGLTLVIVGMNDNDNYVYNEQNQVYDNLAPCPYTCDNSSVTLVD